MTLSSDRSATSRFRLGGFVSQLLQLARSAGQHAAVLFLPAIKRRSEIPTWRHKSTTATPAVACCSTDVICSTEKRFFFTAHPPGPSGTDCAAKLTQRMV